MMQLQTPFGLHCTIGDGDFKSQKQVKILLPNLLLNKGTALPCPFPHPVFPTVSRVGKHQSHACLLIQGCTQLGMETRALGMDRDFSSPHLSGQGGGDYFPAVLLLLSPPQLSPAPAQPDTLWSIPAPEQWRKQQQQRN